ncbi:MAG: GGDEF domain-containing protein [Pseudomonadales bacterium]|nr:GGDEF domain-containing protein [Pseudomonadales bacterium]
MLAKKITMRNPLEWEDSSKACLLLFASLLAHLQYLGWAYYLLSHPARDELINIEFALSQLPYFHGIVALSAVLFVIGIIGSLKRSESVLWQHLGAQYYGISLCYFSFVIGTLTMPTGAVLAAAPVVGLILFDRAAVFGALASSTLLILVISYGSALQWWEYAPVIKNFVSESGHLSMFWLTSMLLFTVPHFLMLTIMAAYVLRRWRMREEEVRYLSLTDPLTSVSNRRSAMSHLERELERSRRKGPSLSVVMVDLDHFKRVNDTWGHGIGDEVLVKAAKTLRETVRQNDMVGRLGGEEFLLILPGTDQKGAEFLAERCRQHIAKLEVDTGQREILKVTASMGIYCNEHNRLLESDMLLEYADQALYHAKESGRNRVVIWHEGCA